MNVEMKVKGLMIDPVSGMPIIILKGVASEEVLPIWVGVFEANAIATRLERIEPPRPQTHDLLRDVIEGLGATVERVEITDLREGTFYSFLYLQRDGQTHRIDSRPSDAIALALRTGARLFVDSVALEKSTGTGDGAEGDEAERLRRWLETVDPEELGRYEM